MGQLLGAVQFSGLDLLTGMQVEEQCNAEAFGSPSQATDSFGQLFTSLRDRIARVSCARRRPRRCCPSRRQLGALEGSAQDASATVDVAVTAAFAKSTASSWGAI